MLTKERRERLGRLQELRRSDGIVLVWIDRHLCEIPPQIVEEGATWRMTRRGHVSLQVRGEGVMVKLQFLDA